MFTNVVNFLLIPLYVGYLSRDDYGLLALLLLFSTMAKIVFRLGLDSGFFRIHYELETDAERRDLAGTVALASAALATVLFAAVVLLARPAAALLGLHTALGPRLLVLAALDVYVGTFAFVPLNLLRIQNRPGLFSSLAAVRHLVNTGLKVLLLMHGFGVAGVLWSDALATTVLSASLLPLLRGNASWNFRMPLLREALHFGLPKVPHGILVQALNLADRRILEAFVTLAEVGVYQMAYTFGMGVKFAMSAFEPAWQPFLYAQAKTPGARPLLARVATLAFAGFAFLGLAFAIPSREVLTIMTTRNPAFRAAAPVIPIVTLAYVLQGVFLLTSIGIGIERRARYYPMITAAAAATNIVLNLLWIPRFGILGAAWATVAGYAVMALLGFVISQRLFPMPLEGGALARITALAAVVYALSTFGPTALVPALAYKAALVLAFPAGLWALGVLGRGRVLEGGV